MKQDDVSSNRRKKVDILLSAVLSQPSIHPPPIVCVSPEFQFSSSMSQDDGLFQKTKPVLAGPPTPDLTIYLPESQSPNW
jgi:hypothetical protein